MDVRKNDRTAKKPDHTFPPVGRTHYRIFLLELYKCQNRTGQNRFSDGESFFDLIVMTREWNAWHGGLYVPVTPETIPNPYLETPMRDIHANEQLN